MNRLAHRRIILGVCGSIAAYKSVLLLRGLQREGAQVRVVLTEAARRFVQPLTFSTLAQCPVLTELWDTGADWTAHVAWAEWAELLVVAPCTAQTLAKLAAGACDNFLTALYLSARCPVVLAPAMDREMYRHPATRRNLAQLAADGCTLIEPDSGFLSSGLEGQGRMPEPADLVEQLVRIFNNQAETDQDSVYGKMQSETASEAVAAGRLAGKKVLVTAGPTREAIDPVRYLSNHSTGKMGIALAAAATAAGAETTLLLGPTDVPPPREVRTLRFTSAADLETLLAAEWPAHDLLIMTAAVADYTPAQPASHKLKKNTDTLTLHLRPTPDLLAAAAAARQPHQRVVGFALETDEAETNARRKLAAKQLDAIVLNSLADGGAGFGHDTNRVTVFDRQGGRRDFPLQAKTELAHHLIDYLADRCFDS